MRWLVVWLALTGVLLAGQLVAPLFSSGSWSFTKESLLHLATVPLAQVAALWTVMWVRRRSRSPGPPPPAPETAARRPGAEP